MVVLETKPPAAEAGAPGTSPDPEAGSRHCAECRSPLAADQACCLECGAVVRDHRWYRRWLAARWPMRVGLATGTGLLLSTCVGLGVSVAFQGGGQIPPPLVSKAPPHAAVPGGVVPPAVLPTVPKATPAPVAPQSPATPAHATPAPTSPSATAAANAAKSTGASRGLSGGNGAGTGTTTPGASSSQRPGRLGSPAGGEAFPNGVPISSANYYDPNGVGSDSSDPYHAIDRDNSTAWTTSRSGVGLWLDGGPGSSYTKLGILPKSGDGGYQVELYGTNSYPSGPPTGPNWTDIGSSSGKAIDGKREISLSSQGYRYYLIWITSLSGTAGIAETALIP